MQVNIALTNSYNSVSQKSDKIQNSHIVTFLFNKTYSSFIVQRFKVFWLFAEQM